MLVIEDETGAPVGSVAIADKGRGLAYLGMLCVAPDRQAEGLGRRLIAETHKAAGPQTMLLLVAAPAAEGYYPKIGMQQRPSCWTLPRSA